MLGKSSGGFGAMHLVIAHPGVFAAFASHSGDSYFRYAHFPAFRHRSSRARSARLSTWLRSWRPLKPNTSGTWPNTRRWRCSAYAAAYSPGGARAFDLDLPFDRETGELRDDVFARWLAFDPAERVAGCQAELSRLRLRYLDCGRRDEYNLDIGARVIARRIRDLGLEVRHEEFDDDHRNVGYRYAISLPALAAVLDHE